MDNIQLLEIKEIAYSSQLDGFTREELNTNSIDIARDISISTKTEHKNQVNVEFEVIIRIEKDGNFKNVVQLKTSFKFHVDNLDNLKKKRESSELALDEKVLYEILNTTIGGTRGMLAYKIASLPFDFILPLVDIDDILKRIKKSPTNK